VSFHPPPYDTRKSSVASDKRHMSVVRPSSGSSWPDICEKRRTCLLSGEDLTTDVTYGSQAFVTFLSGLTLLDDMVED
jgi:hypothetical protein